LDGSTQADREPLQAYLTKAMGRPVNVAAPDLLLETSARLGAGSYDFACLGALMYIRSRAWYGVIPLVQRTSDLHLHSVFTTRTGSSSRSLHGPTRQPCGFGDIN